MQYYFTENRSGMRITTPVECADVSEAREWFIACGIHMAIDPQPVEPSPIKHESFYSNGKWYVGYTDDKGTFHTIDSRSGNYNDRVSKQWAELSVRNLDERGVMV